MAYKEVADSSSGSGFLINDGEARALSNSPAKSSYEDKPPSSTAFFFERINTMQRKRENNGGQETPGARMSKVTRMGLPSPKKVPGYLAVGGPAFPGTSRANAEKNRKVERRPLWGRSHASETSSTGVWGALERYERLQLLRDSEEHIAYSRDAMMRTFSEYSTSEDEAIANVGRIAIRVANAALGAEPPRWQVPERQTFRDYLVSTAKSHGMSESLMGENFGVLLKETDEKLRDPRVFVCQDGDDDMYRRVPARTRPIYPPDAPPYASYDPWGSLNRDATVRRVPHPAPPSQAPGRSAPRDAAAQARSDFWAPLNREIKYDDIVQSVSRPLGADDMQRGAGGHRSVPAAVPEARAVEPEMPPNRAAAKKPLVLITPDDFLTLSNTDISSMLEGAKSNKTDTESVKTSQPTDDNSDDTDGKSSSDSDEGSPTDSDHQEDSTQSDDDDDGDGSDENEEYIHPMQIISDSIDKVDSWLQKHADVLGAGVTATTYVDVAPLFEMPADDEVVERCQDIKRRDCESTLDYARRKLRANCIKFERVAAKFEKLYNEHLLEKCWLAELEAMKIKMSMKRPAMNKSKPDEAPAPADINAPGPSGISHDAHENFLKTNCPISPMFKHMHHQLSLRRTDVNKIKKPLKEKKKKSKATKEILITVYDCKPSTSDEELNKNKGARKTNPKSQNCLNYSKKPSLSCLFKKMSNRAVCIGKMNRRGVDSKIIDINRNQKGSSDNCLNSHVDVRKKPTVWNKLKRSLNASKVAVSKSEPFSDSTMIGCEKKQRSTRVNRSRKRNKFGRYVKTSDSNTDKDLKYICSSCFISDLDKLHHHCTPKCSENFSKIESYSHIEGENTVMPLIQFANQPSYQELPQSDNIPSDYVLRLSKNEYDQFLYQLQKSKIHNLPSDGERFFQVETVRKNQNKSLEIKRNKGDSLRDKLRGKMIENFKISNKKCSSYAHRCEIPKIEMVNTNHRTIKRVHQNLRRRSFNFQLNTDTIDSKVSEIRSESLELRESKGQNENLTDQKSLCDLPSHRFVDEISYESIKVKKKSYAINTSDRSSVTFCDNMAQTSFYDLKRDVTTDNANSLDKLPKRQHKALNVTKDSSNHSERILEFTDDKNLLLQGSFQSKVCHFYLFSVLLMYFIYLIFIVVCIISNNNSDKRLGYLESRRRKRLERTCKRKNDILTTNGDGDSEKSKAPDTITITKRSSKLNHVDTGTNITKKECCFVSTQSVLDIKVKQNMSAKKLRKKNMKDVKTNTKLDFKAKDGLKICKRKCNHMWGQPESEVVIKNIYEGRPLKEKCFDTWSLSGSESKHKDVHRGSKFKKTCYRKTGSSEKIKKKSLKKTVSPRPTDSKAKTIADLIKTKLKFINLFSTVNKATSCNKITKKSSKKIGKRIKNKEKTISCQPKLKTRNVNCVRQISYTNCDPTCSRVKESKLKSRSMHNNEYEKKITRKPKNHKVQSDTSLYNVRMVSRKFQKELMKSKKSRDIKTQCKQKKYTKDKQLQRNVKQQNNLARDVDIQPYYGDCFQYQNENLNLCRCSNNCTCAAMNPRSKKIFKRFSSKCNETNEAAQCTRFAHQYGRQNEKCYKDSKQECAKKKKTKAITSQSFSGEPHYDFSPYSYGVKHPNLIKRHYSPCFGNLPSCSYSPFRDFDCLDKMARDKKHASKRLGFNLEWQTTICRKSCPRLLYTQVDCTPFQRPQGVLCKLCKSVPSCVKCLELQRTIAHRDRPPCPYYGLPRQPKQISCPKLQETGLNHVQPQKEQCSSLSVPRNCSSCHRNMTPKPICKPSTKIMKCKTLFVKKKRRRHPLVSRWWLFCLPEKSQFQKLLKRIKKAIKKFKSKRGMPKAPVPKKRRKEENYDDICRLLMKPPQRRTSLNVRALCSQCLQMALCVVACLFWCPLFCCLELCRHWLCCWLH